MSGYATPILQWLNQNPELAGLAVFIISAAESVAIIGTIVPGTVTMAAVGALAGAGVIPLWSTILWAIAGAVVGDGISYWIGHYFKDRIRGMWPFRDNPKILEKGEHFVHKYGIASVFIGRFVGPVRALVPVVAGMLGMKPLQFTIANVTSAIGWAPAYMLPGILLGALSMELPTDIAMHVILGFILAVLLIALCIWLLVKILQLVHKQIDKMQDWMWRKMKKSTVFYPVTVLLQHHDPKRKHGHLNLGLYFIISSVLFVALVCYVKLQGPSNIVINDALFHLARSIRNPSLDNVMLNITLLGQKQVLFPVILVVFGYLAFSRHLREASHAFMLAIFAMGGVFVFKHLLEITRPWGVFARPTSYSTPSGHSVLSATVYIGMAFLIATSMRRKNWRWLVYTIAVTATLLVGLSRVYLGVHWFTDVIAGWLLSTSILCFVIISYERDAEKRIKPAVVLAFFLVPLALSLGIYHYRHFSSMQIGYAKLDWPVEKINARKWWSKDHEIPEYYTSLFGFKSKPINIQWVGSLDQIEASLRAAGWETPPDRNWASTLHRIADISSSQYLPMISPQYQDKAPELILTRANGSEDQLMVIRMFNSNRVLKTNQAQLWVGNITIIPSTYNWVYHKMKTFVEVNPKLLLSKNEKQKWQYKLMQVLPPHHKSKSHLTILIRPQ